MVQYVSKKITLTLLATAVCGFFTMSTMAMDDSDDDSGCCGCFGSSRKKDKSESERLVTNSDERPSNPLSMERGDGALGYQQTPLPREKASSAAPTPPLLSAEQASTSSTSRSRAGSSANSDIPQNQFQKSLLEMRRSGKLKKSAWTLLTNSTWGEAVHNAIQQLITELQDPDAEFDISFQTGDECEIEYTTKGQKSRKCLNVNNNHNCSGRYSLQSSRATRHGGAVGVAGSAAIHVF